MNERLSGFIKEYGMTAVIIAVGLAIIVLVQNQGAVSGTHPLEGKAAPAFTAPLIDGGTLEMADQGGKVVVLDFWASWCPPCREGLPKIDALAKEFTGQSVAFFAVSLDQNPEDAKAFAEKHDLAIPVALDTSGRAAGEYGVESIPQTVIVGKDGTVREVHVGAGAGLKATLRRGIESALTPAAGTKPA